MNHADLLACIRSGQLSEAQIAEAMRDPEFVEYWIRAGGPRHKEADMAEKVNHRDQFERAIKMAIAHTDDPHVISVLNGLIGCGVAIQSGGNTPPPKPPKPEDPTGG